MTEKKDYPAAVLIRGVKIIKNSPFKKGRCLEDRGIYKISKENKVLKIPPSPPFSKGEIINLNGPGKVCRELKIGKKLNGWDITKEEKIWIASPKLVRPGREKIIVAGRRVGVDYAGHCKEYLWRFTLASK